MISNPQSKLLLNQTNYTSTGSRTSYNKAKEFKSKALKIATGGTRNQNSKESFNGCQTSRDNNRSGFKEYKSFDMRSARGGNTARG